MDYQNTLKYLYESTPMFQQIGGKAYKPGLETTHKLDEHLGHPHQQFRTIHIAGTNGKGSCSHTIAAVLQAAGYKVGLFTSPHLIDFRERIRINGEMIPEDYVVSFVEEHRSFFEPLHPSFFELTTAMAFRYFADQQVDTLVQLFNSSAKTMQAFIALAFIVKTLFTAPDTLPTITGMSSLMIPAFSLAILVSVLPRYCI